MSFCTNITEGRLSIVGFIRRSYYIRIDTQDLAYDLISKVSSLVHLANVVTERVTRPASYVRRRHHEGTASVDAYSTHLLVRRRLTFRGWKPMPTAKLATQFMSTAIDIAAGRGPWLKSSAVIIQGMEPGPTAKNTTKPSMDTTAKAPLTTKQEQTFLYSQPSSVPKICSIPNIWDMSSPVVTAN
ncbi:hypothetical protein AGLY_004586 [Aphis glycines]|uniref:Uncharacterized protein n=1 Tax=Aphis glycines TaxID=307491 RepID=A0A6G0TUQ7_APHGL|nr:hypothetical protein AGLY_004586 [Aphis glycines]